MEVYAAMEGVSLLPLLRGTSLDRKSPLGFEHHGNLALRDGQWKIVSQFRGGKQNDQLDPRQWQLFDMEADRTEQNDLAKTEPEKLAELVGKWQAWADRVGVQVWPIKKR
jgi:arylsulfatase A-like enzyme